MSLALSRMGFCPACERNRLAVIFAGAVGQAPLVPVVYIKAALAVSRTTVSATSPGYIGPFYEVLLSSNRLWRNGPLAVASAGCPTLFGDGVLRFLYSQR